jgi:hypothetical protein
VKTWHLRDELNSLEGEARERMIDWLVNQPWLKARIELREERERAHLLGRAEDMRRFISGLQAKVWEAHRAAMRECLVSFHAKRKMMDARRQRDNHARRARRLKAQVMELRAEVNKAWKAWLRKDTELHQLRERNGWLKDMLDVLEDDPSLSIEAAKDEVAVRLLMKSPRV